MNCKKKPNQTNYQPIIDFQYLAQLVEIHTVTDSESGMTTTPTTKNKEVKKETLRIHANVK